MLLWHARGSVLSVSVRVAASEPGEDHPYVPLAFTGRGGQVPSSIIAEPVTTAQESMCSARNAASKNDVDDDTR